jgi:hypothetical protein
MSNLVDNINKKINKRNNIKEVTMMSYINEEKVDCFNFRTTVLLVNSRLM